MSNTLNNQQASRSQRGGIQAPSASSSQSASLPEESPQHLSKVTQQTKSKPPRPPSPVSPPSAPSYATPGELLKAAAEMGEEDARELLLRELRLRGLREVDLELIKPDCKLCLTGRGSQLAFWIRRFREAAEQWSNLPFDNIGNMSRSWELALTAAQCGYTRSAIRWIQFRNWRFENQADIRKWRFWMLGNVWRELEVEPNLPIDIAGWLRTLLKQSESEQKVLLHLWQADHDRWEFDKISARNLCPERLKKMR